MIRAAVIGLGVIAPMHLGAINAVPYAQLAAVCDIDAACAGSAPGVPFYSDYTEMIEREKPDVVHICLPHVLHYPAAKFAAEHGCHVFCEKPLAMNADEADAFCRLEREHPELKIGVCLQNRLNNSVVQLKHILETGECGPVTAVKGVMLWRRDAEYYTSKPWRGRLAEAGGGCMMNQAVHTLDLLQYLGGPVANVKAVVGQLNEYGVEVEDTAAAKLLYENGAQGLFVATLANFRDEFLHIALRAGCREFEIENETLYEVFPDGERRPIAADERLAGEKFYYGSGHVRRIAEFYDAVRTGCGPYVTVRQAAESIYLIDAINRSAREGRAVAVRRPERNDLKL